MNGRKDEWTDGRTDTTPTQERRVITVRNGAGSGICNASLDRLRNGAGSGICNASLDSLRNGTGSEICNASLDIV